MSPRIRAASATVAILCAGVLLAACQGGGGSGGTQPSAASATGADAASTAAPPEESTGAEQPLPQNDRPALRTVGLPIGGHGVDGPTSPECVPVHWSGQPAPSNGIAVRITGIRVDGAFRPGDGLCTAPCAQSFAFTDAGSECQVSVAWTAPPVDVTISGAISMAGGCVAPDADTCTRWITQIPATADRVSLTFTGVQPESGSSDSSGAGPSSAGSSG